jgi:hypothetical protein
MSKRTTTRHGAFLLLGLFCALVAGPALAFDQAAAARTLQVARRKLARTAAQVPVGQYPKSSRPDGTWLLVPATDMIGWTQGFFPGELWLMYDQSRDLDWRTRAEAWTRPLEVQQCNMQTHDLGFKFMPSYGLAYQMTSERSSPGAASSTMSTACPATPSWAARAASGSRVNPAGFIDAFNGTRYAASSSVPYTANTTYHIRILADLPAQRYSVWVRSPGGPEVLLANRFAFRPEAPVMDDIGQLSLKSTLDSEFSVAGHVMVPVTGFLPQEEEQTPAPEE